MGGDDGAEGDEVLQGGVANAGAVVRRGEHVVRPANPHSATIHRWLTELRAAGFEGASLPVTIENGREHLVFVPGDVAIPPYPGWVQTDEALTSTVDLLHGLHEASLDIGLDDGGAGWSSEMADPSGGPVLCHNDVCVENVVFRDGRAVALLDFDFAAPGRRSFDVAAFARMCVPIDDDVNAARLGWSSTDRPRRLRLVADAYGLDERERHEVIDALGVTIAAGGEFVRRHAEAREPGFVEMWAAMGGQERFDRRRAWWEDERHRFAAALAVSW